MRGFDGIDLGDPVELKDSGAELAHRLVAKLSRESFDPSRYEDTRDAQRVQHANGIGGAVGLS